MKRSRPYPPAYCDASELAYQLSMTRREVESLASMGHLPAPRMIGTSLRWRWSDVDAYVSGVAIDVAQRATTMTTDPYMAGINAITPPIRAPRQGARTRVSGVPKGARHQERRAAHTAA